MIYECNYKNKIITYKYNYRNNINIKMCTSKQPYKYNYRNNVNIKMCTSKQP